MADKKVLILAGKGMSTNIVFNALHSRFNVRVIIEEKENKKFFLKRRIKKLGIFTVAGQIIFQAFAVPLLSYSSKKRSQTILKQNNLDEKKVAEPMLQRVTSVNNDMVLKAITEINPDVIVVNGTRIISRRLLNAIKCPVINTHTGITPMYRGVHGGYWALVNKDPAHCGVTVHLIDPGIDTGDILYQGIIKVDNKDNFVTYPLKQLAAGVPLLIQAVEDALSGRLQIVKPEGKSALWSHPTIWQYLYHRIFDKVK